MKKVIGIAAGRKYDNYLNWILKDPDAEIIKLGYEDNNFDMITHCHGLVLSGGEDVHPRFYGKPEYFAQYNLDDVDEARDEFEWKLLRYSEEHRLPVLGICRGLQIANAYYGGTLIPDIPSYGKPDHTKFGEGKDRNHDIAIARGSLLEEITGASQGQVNSAHHQGVAEPAKELAVCAVSNDGIVEAMERKDRANQPFLLLVQWHPERMTDQLSVLSKNIRERLIESIHVH